MKLELIADKAKKFPSIEKPEKYSEIEIIDCNYTSLSSLRDFVNAKSLEIRSIPDGNIDFLKPLKKLKVLKITHFPKLSDISPISHLNSLEQLYLASLTSWDASGKRLTIKSLCPVVSNHIKSISILGVNLADNDLLCLSKCKNLREVNVGNLFNIKQLAGLKANKPTLEGTFFTPFIEIPFDKCSKCGHTKVMLSGVIKHSMKCPNCNKKRVGEHIDEWNDILKRKHSSTCHKNPESCIIKT